MKNKLFLVLLIFIINFSNSFAQCSITTSTDSGTLACGVAPLSGCNGVVYIGDGTNPMILNMDETLDLSCLGSIQLIVRNNASMDFSPGNSYLILGVGSSLVLQPGSGLIGGSCNASERIYIGTDLIASCNGQGPGADYSFAQLLANGGYNVVNATGSPASGCGTTTFTLTGSANPSSGVTFRWYNVASGGTPLFSGNPYTPSVSSTTTYYVEGYYSATNTTTARKAIIATINPLASTPTIGTVVQPDCINGTSSIQINNLPAGSWTLTRSGTSNGTTSGSGTSTTVTGLAAGTYAFSVNNGTCGSNNSANVTINDFAPTTWNGSTWSAGTPTPAKQAIINGNFNTGTNGSFTSCSLVINSPYTVTIASNTYLVIQNSITGTGSLIVQNNGSLIQVNNVVNTQNITFYRNSNVKLLDYIYWSSPVANFNVTNVSPSSTLKYKWGPVSPNPNGGEGYWLTASGNMNVGEGYIIRTPGISPYNNSTPNNLTATFTGVPNNGTYNINVYRGNDYTTIGTQGLPRTARDDNFNLLGNPYPSAIGVNEFLNANSSVIESYVAIWTHNQNPSTISSPFYQYFATNYYENDYLIVNQTGATSGPGDYYIGAGQSFMVEMKPGAPGSGIVTFNNAMRSSSFPNNLFFRSNITSNEMNRIWLDLVSNNEMNRILIGYMKGASDAKDKAFDAVCDDNKAQNFYSLLEDEKMSIQGKSLPFNTADMISLGVKIPTSGSYKIALASVDGLFSDTNQAIYLEDTFLHKTHNLREKPYSFESNSGEFTNRFLLHFKAENLTNSDENAVSIFQNNHEINIVSTSEKIKNYEVYDILGRVLLQENQVNVYELNIYSLAKNNQPLLIKIQLDNNEIITKKIIF